MTTGSCLCGQLKYSFTGEPSMKALCHCSTCRKLSGSAFTTNLLVPQSSFSFTTGTPKTHVTKHETGMLITVHFCPGCGTTVMKEGDSESLKGMAIVQAGTLDGGGLEEAAPGVELWSQNRVGWLSGLEGVGQVVGFGDQA